MDSLRGIEERFEGLECEPSPTEKTLFERFVHLEVDGSIYEVRAHPGAQSGYNLTLQERLQNVVRRNQEALRDFQQDYKTTKNDPAVDRVLLPKGLCLVNMEPKEFLKMIEEDPAAISTEDPPKNQSEQ